VAKEKSDDANMQFKDLVNPGVLDELAAQVARVHRRFDKKAFVKAVLADNLEGRELKDRINTIARHLRDFLPPDYPKAVTLLVKMAPSVKGILNWVATSFVEQFGLDHPDDSIPALRELTKYGSSEFAVRPYVVRYQERMLAEMHTWAEDDNEHVRRLAAEGSRPRGVWTIHIDAFKRDPAPVLQILERLKADPSEYVRKAVANNLNDISKDHPDLVIRTALKWKKDGEKNTDWIVKHACRTLIKHGHPDVFAVFGYTANPKLQLENLKLSAKSVRIGGEITFSFDLVSQAKTKQRLVIDYHVHFVKKSGKRSPKVFKLTEKSLGPGETITVTKRQSFADHSTRKHLPGDHTIEIFINGISRGAIDFPVRR